MDMKGDTACYLQYTYARAKGILRKSPSYNCDNIKFGKAEYAILTKLAMFNIIVNKARCAYSPAIIANYSLEIAGMFNSFYATYPVLNAEEEIKNGRLFLTKAFCNTLKDALSLLLIDCAEEI